MKFHIVITFFLGVGALPQNSSNPDIVTYGCEFPYEIVGGLCLYIDNVDSGSWDNMSEICSSGSNKQMAMIKKSDSLYDIVQYINQYHMGDTDFWIGATDRDHEGFWRWIDNSNMQYGTPFWAYNANGQSPEGGPTKNCAFLDHKNYYYFNDGDCEEKKGVICYYDY